MQVETDTVREWLAEPPAEQAITTGKRMARWERTHTLPYHTHSFLTKVRVYAQVALTSG